MPSKRPASLEPERHHSSDRKFWIPCSSRMPERAAVVLKGSVKHSLDWDVWEEAGSSVSSALPVHGGISVPG